MSNKKIFLFIGLTFFTQSIIHSLDLKKVTIPDWAKPKISEDYNSSKISANLGNEYVKASIRYDFGFEGCGDESLAFPEKIEGLVTFNIGPITLNALNLVEDAFINKLKEKDGAKASEAEGLLKSKKVEDFKKLCADLMVSGKDPIIQAQAAALFVLESIVILNAESILLVKFIQLVKAAKKGSPNKYEAIGELLKLASRYTLAKQAQYPNKPAEINLNVLPAPMLKIVESVRFPSHLDNNRSVNSVEFINLRLVDVYNVQNRKFEGDEGYTDAMKAADLVMMSFYEAVKRYLAIAWRAKKDSADALKFLTENVIKKGKETERDKFYKEIEEKFGKEAVEQFKNKLREYVIAASAYNAAKASNNAKMIAEALNKYVKAKNALLGTIIKFAKLRKGPKGDELIMTFLKRELFKAIPRTPGFSYIKPIIDPVLGQLGLNINMIEQSMADSGEKVPEPPVAAVEDPGFNPDEIAID
ncbi:TPA: hypothetical protein DEO28_05235 [Candidatus Dependentiae bacterium]|nr:MAG: hypothetical protein UR14_C0002G0158 [candidate division TM6 bacterium GW2011_GWE2_31_21]KKP53955.1 MAG: hypothetical protein UR43_C0002G0158 [candidate division TM6 bacterium GW2011_GWF2_33_332]HBS47735.1 hypothetical protein [Candidatus Dependentiae bacterium]HBZ73884.1 hypothetical protein [Candidatus Dependentiae bacterium]